MKKKGQDSATLWNEQAALVAEEAVEEVEVVATEAVLEVVTAEAFPEKLEEEVDLEVEEVVAGEASAANLKVVSEETEIDLAALIVLEVDSEAAEAEDLVEAEAEVFEEIEASEKEPEVLVVIKASEEEVEALAVEEAEDSVDLVPEDSEEEEDSKFVSSLGEFECN